jgi:hypothetical protein
MSNVAFWAGLIAVTLQTIYYLCIETEQSLLDDSNETNRRSARHMQSVGNRVGRRRGENRIEREDLRETIISILHLLGSIILVARFALLFASFFWRRWAKYLFILASC